MSRQAFCPFCDEPLVPVNGVFECADCDHSECEDYEPRDPPGWEGGCADNH
jgi:hypothetical protein